MDLGMTGMREPLIAIIDDDPLLRMALENLLRSAGYRVCTYPSAVAFLHKEGERPDLVITDLEMPGGSGLALLEILRMRGNGPPTILTTARLTSDIASRAGRAGAAACLQKPFDDDELFSTIQKVLPEALLRH